MGARVRIANLLWLSVPSGDDAEAKARTNEMLDAFRAEVLNEAMGSLASLANLAPRSERAAGLNFAIGALMALRDHPAAAGQAPAPAVVSPGTGQAESACICGHPKQQHFEDDCLTDCGCGDYLPVDAAAEEIARLRKIIRQKPTAVGQAPAPLPETAPDAVTVIPGPDTAGGPFVTLLAEQGTASVAPELTLARAALVADELRAAVAEVGAEPTASEADGLRERVMGALLGADTYAQLEKRVDRERFADAVLAVLAEGGAS